MKVELFFLISDLTWVDYSVLFSHDTKGGVCKQALSWSELTVRSLSSITPAHMSDAVMEQVPMETNFEL